MENLEVALRATRIESRTQTDRAVDAEAKLAAIIPKHDHALTELHKCNRRLAQVDAELSAHKGSIERCAKLEADIAHAREVTVRLDHHATEASHRLQKHEDLIRTSWEQMVAAGADCGIAFWRTQTTLAPSALDDTKKLQGDSALEPYLSPPRDVERVCGWM